MRILYVCVVSALSICSSPVSAQQDMVPHGTVVLNIQTTACATVEAMEAIIASAEKSYPEYQAAFAAQQAIPYNGPEADWLQHQMCSHVSFPAGTLLGNVGGVHQLLPPTGIPVEAYIASLIPMDENMQPSSVPFYVICPYKIAPPSSGTPNPNERSI